MLNRRLASPADRWSPDLTLARADIAQQRLRNSGLAGAPLEGTENIVGWLCAVQSQDYAGAKWAIGQRSGAVTDAAIDRLFNDGAILRTHVLRPTWHFVLPADIHWMLRLSRPRVKAALAYYDRILELDDALIATANETLAGALGGGARLVRAEIADVYRRSGFALDGQRLGHLLMHAELDGIACSGGLRGRQFTYALLEERAGEAGTLTGDAALAELAARYFASHGPAQVRDFAWWSGLTMRQARSGVEMAVPGLHSATVDGTAYHFVGASALTRSRRPLAHILPNWDEYLVGYADRGLHIDAASFATPPAAGDLLANGVAINGRIVGGWRRTVSADTITVTARLRVTLSGAQRTALERSCSRYSRFLGRPVRLVYEGA